MRPRGAAVRLKSKSDLELMRVAASTTSEILDELVDMVEPGVSTWDLDQAAEEACRRRGVTPAFKGLYGFPGCLCVAVNDVVVHGIPSEAVRLSEGDIIGLDFGVVYRGWYGDHARTVPVGSVSAESKLLMEATAQSMMLGIEACQPGNRLRDIGKAVQRHAEGAGYSVVRDFLGHGIGRRLHEDPPVSNYYDRRQLMRLKAGMVLCVEPMVNIGTADVRVLEDGWTAVSCDGRRSAHFEHTVAITESGPEILSISGHGVG